MISHESHLPIARPASEVLAFVADMTNAPRWQTGLREVRRLTPGPLQVGTEHEFVRRFAGREVASRNRFIAFDPGRYVAFEFPQGSITSQGSYRVVPDGHGGCVLTSRVELNVTGVMRLVQPLLARVLRRDVHRDDRHSRRCSKEHRTRSSPRRRTQAMPRVGDPVGGLGRRRHRRAANVLLAGFYAGRASTLGVVGSAAEWAGPANDVVGAVSTAAMVPMALGLLAHLGRPRGLEVVTWAAVGAMVALSVLGPAAARRHPVRRSAAAAVPAVAVIFGWLLLVGRAGRATRRLPASLSTAAITIGTGLLTAFPLLGAAALLPTGSPRPATPRRDRTRPRCRRVRDLPHLAAPTRQIFARHPRRRQPPAHHAPQPA